MAPWTVACAVAGTLLLLTLELLTRGALPFPGASRLGLVLLLWAALVGVPRGRGAGLGIGWLLALPLVALTACLDAQGGRTSADLLRLGAAGLLLLGLLDRAAERGRSTPLAYPLAWCVLAVLPALLAATLGFARDVTREAQGLLAPLLGLAPLVALHEAAGDPTRAGAGKLLAALAGVLLLLLVVEGVRGRAGGERA